MKLLLSAIFIFFGFCSVAQQKKIDSLLTVNGNYKKEDSIKVIYLNNVFKEYCRLNNLEKLKEFSGKAIEVAQKLPQSYSLTRTYFRLGLCYHGKSMYLQAIDSYNKGIAVANKRKDKNSAAGFYLNLSALYQAIPDYTKALEASDSAVNLFNQIGEKDQLSSCYMNIGSIYNDLQKPVQAVAYIQKALAVFIKADEGINYGVSSAYQGIASSYSKASDAELITLGVAPAEKYQQSLILLFKALQVAEAVGYAASTQIAPLHNDIGKTYEKMDNGKLALAYYQKALIRYNQTSEDKNSIADILFSMGNFYADKKNYDSSLYYLNNSLQIGKENKLLLIQQQALEKISNVYEKTGKFENAIIFYKDFIKVKEEIIDAEKEKEITRKQLQIDFAIKENDYKLVQQVSDGKLKQQQLQISLDKKVKIFLAVAIALALIIGGLIYYDRRKTKKLNALINQQKAELEKLGNVKDKIFSVVSHDMRAPVNSLISFMNILEEGNIAPEKLNLYAKDLKQNLSYTSSLMNNLLNWAASQMQGFKPVKENFDVSAVVTEVANTLQHHWQQKNVLIKNNITPNTIINADVNMTGAILRNLISNAVKYSFKESAVTVTAEQDEAGWNILVQDAGTGMQPGQLEAFNSNAQHQIESKRGTANEKGTGLGLLLCKTFSLQMGGKITAYTKDKGTTFKIWLPDNNTN